MSAGTWELATQLCSAARVAQGAAAAAAMYNYVLRSALDSGQIRPAMGILTLMQSSGLEVEPNTAAKVGFFLELVNFFVSHYFFMEQLLHSIIVIVTIHIYFILCIFFLL